MLVLTRKPGETIELTGGIVITIREWTPTKCWLTIAAPPEIRIIRGELAKKVLDEMNGGAVGSP
jgi:carbon storage regulator CsrA